MENFKEIENKWKKFWEENQGLYRAIDNVGQIQGSAHTKKKKYILVEFPYPSGSGLHVGHAFSFTGGDVYARFKRMQGENVLFPMGWDAFGLPTENYAIKTKKKPQEVTKENTDMFRKQMKDLAFSFDWSREVNTTDPKYYKWTQWIFIKLFEKGLAYKKEMPINWCPSCKIGLANEEVVDGKCERCGAEVSRRNISQWVVKITDYADKLVEGLKETDFIEKVKQAQINWIGKSEGARVRFIISNDKCQMSKNDECQKTNDKYQDGRDVARNVSTEYLEVFTTRPDTLPGATFMVIAPEHELVSQIINMSVETHDRASLQKNIKDYVANARKKSDLERTELSKDKTGVFSGLYAINPVNNKEIPIWISDFVLASYGTGAIMAVPAHDERDWAFAKKFGLPIVPVINKQGWNFDEKPFTEVEKGEEFNKMLDWVEEKGIGERSASYHLRDWIFSRQHYWGEPIPMVNCPKCGWVPVKEDDLPILLPEVEHYEPTDDGRSPLSAMTDWVKTKCPKCGGEAERETDTMPNWAGSDWYFLRYMDPFNDTVLANKDLIKYWGPVDVYVGGDEHNVLHLLYSRFIYKFLWDIEAVPKNLPEPYFKRLSHGVILGPDNQRMSKSKGNVIVPETVADKFGVDVVRMYMMFMGPFDATMAWNENTLMGVKRFLDRFEKYTKSQGNNDTASNKETLVIINKLIDTVTKDLEEFKYNTAIAKMMEALNSLSVGLSVGKEELKILIKLVAPFAPYLAEELYNKLNAIETHHDASLQKNYTSVHVAAWPVADKQYLVDDQVTVVISVNGRVRDQILVDSEAIDNKEMVLEMARKSEKLQKWIEGKEIIKEIYIPRKMINFVIV